MAATTVVLALADRLQRWLGERAVLAFERLMGLVLTALAVEMLLSGVRSFAGERLRGAVRRTSAGQESRAAARFPSRRTGRSVLDASNHDQQRDLVARGLRDTGLHSEIRSAELAGGIDRRSVPLPVP